MDQTKKEHRKRKESTDNGLFNVKEAPDILNMSVALFLASAEIEGCLERITTGAFSRYDTPQREEELETIISQIASNAE